MSKITNPEPKYTSKENIVSSFFFFMWNAWCKEECETVFGYGFQHFWNKWCGFYEKYSVYAATDRFYADLTTDNREKLVNRACELFDGSKRCESKQENRV